MLAGWSAHRRRGLLLAVEFLGMLLLLIAVLAGFVRLGPLIILPDTAAHSECPAVRGVPFCTGTATMGVAKIRRSVTAVERAASRSDRCAPKSAR